MSKDFIVRGNLCWTKESKKMSFIENGFLVCVDGKIAGVFEELPECFKSFPVIDYKDMLIVPGLYDLHLHAPQYAFRSLSMDMELMDWLNTYTFPEEAKYEDLAYAQKAYSIFTDALKYSATCRAVIFATLHVPATKLLMELLEDTGLKTYVGKVNMDRNSPDILCEKSWEMAANDTRKWLEDTIDHYKNVQPVLTPRFTPSCSRELMMALGELQKQFRVPVQSHLSENPTEQALVAELEKDCRFYGETYDKAGLFGTNGPSIMAHCVYSSQEEQELMKKQGVFIAHCPQSNINLASGIAPVRHYMEQGQKVGLGTDVAGGYSLSVFRAMSDAVGVSKLYWRYVDGSAKPLSASEAFYLGTKGGGSFFGKCGSFEEGYAADFVVLDDKALPHPQSLTVAQRVERMIFLSEDTHIQAKYIEGERIFDKTENGLIS